MSDAAFRFHIITMERMPALLHRARVDGDQDAVNVLGTLGEFVEKFSEWRGPKKKKLRYKKFPCACCALDGLSMKRFQEFKLCIGTAPDQKGGLYIFCIPLCAACSSDENVAASNLMTVIRGQVDPNARIVTQTHMEGGHA